MKADSQVSGLRKSAFGRKAATPFSIQMVLAAFDSSCVRLFIHTEHEKQGPDITKNIYITGTHHSLRLLRETSRSVPWYGGITTSCCYKSSATIQQINSNFSTNTRPPLSLPDIQPWLPLPARLLPSVLVQHAENHQKKLRLCSGCKTTRYCSTVCQKANWRFHKPICYRPVIGPGPPPQNIDPLIAGAMTPPSAPGMLNIGPGHYVNSSDLFGVFPTDGMCALPYFWGSQDRYSQMCLYLFFLRCPIDFSQRWEQRSKCSITFSIAPADGQFQSSIRSWKPGNWRSRRLRRKA